ncbi:RNA polymerase sigma factor [Rhodohalobacter halophilus]|uniref:RNA polymerase sigma factor n=1 Tax=Rhodohalobacter halophilus TaxID=1812810 RepID=UPI00083FA3A8|nr:sigma-70 family RNA polymerase sigma factor [Rhodohalobacter halophilus]
MILLLTPEIVLLVLALSKEGDMDDTALSLAIKNGDQKAFEEFFNRHYDPLYRFLISRRMEHEEARDLAQKAFVMIWEKRQGIDETKSLRSYLFTIAYSRMLNHVEYRSKFSDEDPADNHSPALNTDHSIDFKELVNVIRQIISQMPEKRGMVFDLCFMQEFSYKEAADAMDVSPKTIENHMALAFKDLRKKLTQMYGESLLTDFQKSNK